MYCNTSKTLLILFLIVSQAIICQENQSLKINDSYYITSTFETNSTLTYFGKKINSSLNIHKQNVIIKISNIIGDSVIFQYWKFKIPQKKDSSRAINNNIAFFKDTTERLLYFYLPKKNFENLTTKYFPKFKGAVAGFYSVPFKLRFNDFDFEQNLNLGLNIGFQYRFSKKIEDRWIIEPNIGFGISKVNLDENNSNVTENRSASAFSATVGVILRVTNTINLGAFLGKDFLGKNDLGTNWQYNKKTWLGLGLNVGFSVNDRKKGTDIKNTVNKDGN